MALEPPEKKFDRQPFKIWSHDSDFGEEGSEYHLAPEIFVSEGTPGSIVYDWVTKRNGIGGVHHMAYQVDNVEQKMEEWKNKGLADFTSDTPFKCEGLTQVFTKPMMYTGVIFEFIEREEVGFCKDNVLSLMLSTAKADENIK